MANHEAEISLIIDRTRCGDDNILHDSKEIAKIVMAYINYHFELKERLNFQADQLN